MKTNLQKLTDILCTVPEIEKDIKELRFGYKVWIYRYKTDSYIYWYIVNKNEISSLEWWTYMLEDYPFYENTNPEWDNFIDWDKWYTDKIWNPIQERNLRMYCNEKEIFFMIEEDWMLRFHDSFDVIKLDNTKDLQDQTEETLWKIVEFLTK